MKQDVLVFAIILATISYIVFSLIKNLRLRKIKSGCGGCTGCELSKKKCD